jgi:hypothetical protein
MSINNRSGTVRNATRSLGVALVVLLASLASSVPPASADASQAPGPALSEPVSALRAALECSAGINKAKRDPVLLIHGIAITAEESWSWGYRKVLPEHGFPTCTVSLPDRRMEDIQRSSEYVVYAIRQIAALSGRHVALVAHSGGTMEPLWALRFWPDLAGLVSDYVGLAGSVHGTQLADILCRDPRGCAPAVWQATRGSRFLHALHAHLPPRGPSYTSIATRFDEIVFPQPQSSRLARARNIVLQDVCPARPVEHASILADLVSYRLVVDALTHRGPADPARLPASACLEGFMLPDQRGVEAVANFAIAAVTWRRVAEEPPLRCYADPACSR